MTKHSVTAPHVLYVQARTLSDGPCDANSYEHLLAVLAAFTPLVQAVPPDAAFAEVRGSLRYFDRSATDLAAMIRVRALALHGIDTTIGVAVNPQLARMIAREAPPGAIRTLGGDPPETQAFLGPKPAESLPGVGPGTTRTLAQFGLNTVGHIAATPLATLQRILGATAGRQLLDRARGIDPTPVTPNAPARSYAAQRDFDRDELDPHQHHRALASITEELGIRLRAEKQAAESLTLTVRYADRTTTTRSRRLHEATAHTPDLTGAAHQLYAALRLQRARVRALSLRVEGLADAEHAAHQLTFGAADAKARRLEEAADRARARFGLHVVRPAGLHAPSTRHRPSRPAAA